MKNSPFGGLAHVFGVELGPPHPLLGNGKESEFRAVLFNQPCLKLDLSFFQISKALDLKATLFASLWLFVAQHINILSDLGYHNYQ